MQIKKFSDLNITISPENDVFTGKKKDIEDVLDQEIWIHDYKIVPSKFPEKAYDKCLHLQISIDGKKFVLFSGSKNLILHIEQVQRLDLPISTTIVKRDKKLLFT